MLNQTDPVVRDEPHAPECVCFECEDAREAEQASLLDSWIKDNLIINSTYHEPF